MPEKDTLVTALENRFATFHQEMASVHAQQRLVAQLLSREGISPLCRSVDVARWIAMLDEVGIDEEG